MRSHNREMRQRLLLIRNQVSFDIWYIYNSGRPSSSLEAKFLCIRQFLTTRFTLFSNNEFNGRDQKRITKFD